MQRLILALALALAGALAACSKDSSGPSAPPPPGCSRTSSCYSDPTATATSCGNESGVWLETGCPGAGLVGICSDANGRTTYFYSPTYSSYWAGAVFCISGTFTPMGATARGTCDMRPTIPVCADASGTESDLEAISPTDYCAFYQGTWTPGATCPTAGRKGTCSWTMMGVEILERNYSATNATDADCLSPGDTWIPG